MRKLILPSPQKHQHQSQKVTVQNEQSTINVLMKWLHKNGETHIDGFDFKKLPRLEKGNEAIRRATLTSDEYEALYLLCVHTLPNKTS